MRETIGFLIVGGMFVGMGVASSLFKRLPLTGAMLYLAAGFALGPSGLGLLSLDITKDAPLVRLLTEVALLASLFAIGLRLRAPIFASLWSLPVRLGLLAMIVTVPLLAFFCARGLGMAWGPAWVLAPYALAVVAASVFIHGMSATPLMKHYKRSKRSKHSRRQHAEGQPPSRG